MDDLHALLISVLTKELTTLEGVALNALITGVQAILDGYRRANENQLQMSTRHAQEQANWMGAHLIQCHCPVCGTPAMGCVDQICFTAHCAGHLVAG